MGRIIRRLVLDKFEYLSEICKWVVGCLSVDVKGVDWVRFICEFLV